MNEDGEGSLQNEHNTSSEALDKLRDPAVRNNLISGMSGLFERLDEMEEPPEILLFLDKSARPASWLFREVWHKLYPKKRIPEVKFVNIGREKQLDPDYPGPEFSKEMSELGLMEDLTDQYIAQVRKDTNTIDALRKAFSHKKEGRGKNTQMHKRGILRPMMIVDDHMVEGTSMLTAKILLQEAFGYDDEKLSTHVLFKDEPPWTDEAVKEEWIGMTDDSDSDILARLADNRSIEERNLRGEMKVIAGEVVEFLNR